MLAAMHIGRVACSLSSAYSRLAEDHTRLRGMLDLLGPALVYASDARAYGPAMAACALTVPCVFSANAEDWPGALAFDQLLATRETPAVQQAFATITPDDHAKYLLTSGSTGQPKAVINTHRMLCANQQQMAQTWRFLEHEPPVLVDWLPWSHTFGGNHNFNMVLAHGGALYIDEGRPAPGLVEKTARNLREVQPTLWFNVPRGFDMLLPLMEADDALAADILARLRLAFYAAAALAPSTWQRLQAVAERVRPGRPLWLTTSWGCTETSPAITSAHWQLQGAGCIGNPLPGMEIKFVPNGDKLEMRIKGVSVFPGYRNSPRETAAAFDAEGYYRIGDAGRLLDSARPEAGVVFDGRVSEDFKLSSGTWVSVGTLRVDLVSRLAPLVQDIVVAGHDRAEIGLLVFPSPAGLQQPEALRTALQRVMREQAQAGAGSARSPACALVLDKPAGPGSRRDHRQGLHQPAGRAGAARRGGGPTVRHARGAWRAPHLTPLRHHHAQPGATTGPRRPAHADRPPGQHAPIPQFTRRLAGRAGVGRPDRQRRRSRLRPDRHRLPQHCSAAVLVVGLQPAPGARAPRCTWAAATTHPTTRNRPSASTPTAPGATTPPSTLRASAWRRAGWRSRTGTPARSRSATAAASTPGTRCASACRWSRCGRVAA